MVKQRIASQFKGVRQKLNTLAEGRFRNVLTRLERVPSLEQILRKYVRPFRWPVYFVAGLLVADIGMLALGTFLDKPRPPVPPRPRVISEAPYVRSNTSYDPVVARNAFCPGCPVPDMKIRAVERPKDCNKAQPIITNLKLVGTIVLSDARYSVATVTEGSAESTALLVGDVLPSTGKVLEIRRNRVCFLREDNTLGYVDLPEDTIQIGQPLPTAFAPSIAEGIQRTSDTDRTVKRTFLMDQLNKPDLLFQAYAVPAQLPDGTKGFKVVSINPGSVYESLGIQANDVITGVDGQPMDSVSKAQGLFSTIRTRDSVTIEVFRNGAPVTLNFKITK